MSFEKKIEALAARVPATIEHLQTEEATKNALIMPFIAALGYDVFNPLEVVPEYDADVGKKGEKVDYAIKHEGVVIMLFEAKKAGEPLSRKHAGQLYRYFSVTESSRIAVLTNGVTYEFYSDIDSPNRMDEKPFLVIDLLNLKDDILKQLGRLTKDAFDLSGMLEAAGDLKYMREIRSLLDKQFDEPDDEFVKFFFSQACPGRNFVQSAKEQFARLVKESLRQVLSDRVARRLRSALQQEGEKTELSGSTNEAELAPAEDAHADTSGIVTTDEELEGYRVVRAIVCSILTPERIAHRDTKSYFGILVDDNNRKPLCRLHFNRANKYLGLFDEQKKESRHLVEGPEGIYRFADELRATAQRYSVQSQTGEDATPVTSNSD